jgi:general secretion pathway protein I
MNSFARHPRLRYRAGFTLLEVLVALAIVGTALGASLRAVGSLTQNSTGLRLSLMATWSAENRLAQIRIAKEWPPTGNRSFDCPQGGIALVCQESVFATGRGERGRGRQSGATHHQADPGGAKWYLASGNAASR